MARKPHAVIEYRHCELPSALPLTVTSDNLFASVAEHPGSMLHFHTCLEIDICDVGSGTLALLNEQRPFQAGDILVISANLPHAIWSSENDPAQLRQIMVDPFELLRPFRSMIIPLFSNPAMLTPEDMTQICPTEKSIPLRCSLEQVMDEMRTLEPSYESVVRAFMLGFLIQVCRPQHGSDSLHPRSALPIAPALQYISEHYAEEFPMNRLAALCKMSPAQFRRTFNEALHTSPLDYLNRYRVRRACTMLRMTDDPILSICESVGFRSMTSFNRHFSATVGEAPSAWRKHSQSGDLPASQSLDSSFSTTSQEAAF